MSSRIREMSSFRPILVAFCLISGIGSTRLVCEKLVHPLGSLAPHHLEGRWAFVAGSLSHAPSMEALRLRDSITVFFSNSSDSLSYNQINRFGDQCQHHPYNISVEGSSFNFDVGDRFDLSGSVLHTSCPDCLVMRWLVKSRRRLSVDLYLLSRRREVEPREMEEFRAQLKCFQLPAPVMMDPTKELCPEEAVSQSTAFTQNETRVDQST